MAYIHKISSLVQILAVAVTSFLFFENFFGLPNLSLVELSARMGFIFCMRSVISNIYLEVFSYHFGSELPFLKSLSVRPNQ